MTAQASPALEPFLLQVGTGLTLGQVLIQPLEPGYELRHETDRACPAAALRTVPLPELRALTQSTVHGAFRPLKSAPTLQAGWRLLAPNPAELEAALNILYPGALADWFATRSNPDAATPYREFTDRQTGMYRITALLTDEQAAGTGRACCDRRFCLKRRLWTGPGLPADPVEEKSLIPCLEPCAILMEFARKVARLDQDDRLELPPLSQGELETLEAALQTALESPAGGEREADFGSPLNPRRVLLLLEKLRARPPAGAPQGS